MVAPIVAGIIGLLGGATLPAALVGAGIGAEYGKTIAAIDTTSALVYADIEKVCPASHAAVDLAAAKADATWGKKHTFWIKIVDRAVQDSDAVCAASYGPNTTANRLRAAAQALDTIARVNKLIRIAPARTVPAPTPPTVRARR